MVHIARADEDEDTTEDEDIVSMPGPDRAVTTTNAYIESLFCYLSQQGLTDDL